MFKKIIFIIFFCSLSFLNAQIDSLAKKSHEELVDLYHTFLTKNINKASIYAAAVNKLAIQKGNKLHIAWSQFYIAQSCFRLAKYKLAMEYINRSLHNATDLQHNTLLFKNHNLKGNVLSEKENELEAIDAYLVAKKYAKLSGDPMHLIVVHSNIAFIKKLHKNYNEAILILKENLTQLKKINSPKKEFNEIITLMNLSDTYLRLNNTKDAEYYNRLALKKCPQSKYSRAYFVLVMNEAIINFQKENYNDAIVYSKKVHAYFSKIKNEDQLATPNFYIGKSYYKQKKYEDAIPYLEKVNEIVFKKNINFPDLEETNKILLLCYNIAGKPEKAAEAFNKYSKLDEKNDSLNIEVLRKVYTEHDKVDLEEKIDFLDHYGQQQKNRALLWYIVSGVLILSLVLFFILYRKKQQQAKIRFQKLLLTIERLEQSKTKPIKPKTFVITDESVLEILEGLKKFEAKKYYLRQDCNLGFVAKKLKTNTSYLSSVINTHKGKSFKSYLAELRINAALIRLKNDKKLRAYTIKAIAEEFGFKRHETFSRAFKAQTDMHPSYYIKSLDNQNNTV